MKFLKRNTNIDFMGKRNFALVFSLVLIAAALVSLPVRSLNFGLDFTGGTLIEVSFPTAPDISDVRGRLADGGMDAMVQTFGAANDIVVAGTMDG